MAPTPAIIPRFLVVVLTFIGCADAMNAPRLGLTSLELQPPQQRLEPPLQLSHSESAEPLGERIARAAERRVGAHELEGGGRKFAFDSVGLARAVMLDCGIDVFAAPAAGDKLRTGVDIVYQYAALHGDLHSLRVPEPGDLVFFGKTRDADGDGKPDALSHVGIVGRVHGDGTADIVTTTMTGVVSLPMNRRFPDRLRDAGGGVLNERLLTPMGGEPKPLPELFYSFARLNPR